MVGRINISNAGKYGSNNGSEFFTLEDDGDIARVRMLYDQPDGSDLDYYLVHEVEIEGRKKYIACNALGEDGTLHPDNCPLCQAKYRRIEKLFLQMYLEEEDKYVVWERGRNFVNTIQTYINRYGSLVQQPIEIERHGKKGSTSTTYVLFPLEVDGATIDDYPEKQELIGTLILELTAEQMEDVIDGKFRLNGHGRQQTRRRSEGRAESQSTQPTPAPTRRRERPSTSNSTPADVQPQQQEQQVNNGTVPEQNTPRRTIRRGRGRATDSF